MNFLRIWARQAIHNAAGIWKVFVIIKFRPLGPKLLAVDHPWCVGGPDHWRRNIIYQTPPRMGLASTERALNAVGYHMADIVRSAAEGRPGRAPWGIRYLHGPVHYNGGWVIFNDLEDAYTHMADPKFVEELQRFAREEQREIVCVFRQKRLDPEEYANLICMIRCLLPWFSNSNGPGKNVLWGNPSPYPAINMITGWWRADIDTMAPCCGAPICRPTIEPGKYFQEGPGWCYWGFGREWPQFRWYEILLKHLTRLRIKARGKRGNLFFIDRRKTG